jgi:hypothetical protein
MNKNGVSVMVGYVLLVVIAVGLSVAVFSYLKLYLPKDEPECNQEIVLTIDEVSCFGEGADGFVSVKLSNRGLFSVNGVFIRIGDRDRVFKELLTGDELLFTPEALAPGEEYDFLRLSYDGYVEGQSRELEIEPFVYIDNEPALCEKSVVSKLVNCVTV